MSGPTVCRSLVLLLPAMIAVAPIAAAAQTIVVRSAGPSAATYPAGKRIANGQQLALRKGDLITILGTNGSREFRGPGQFSIDARTMTGTNIAKAVGNSGSKTTRTGAVRGGGRWGRPANLWMLEADRSGKACYAAGRNVAIWLPRINFAYSMTLTRLKDNKDVPMALGAGQRIASWPSAELPPTPGERVRITTIPSQPGTVVEFVDVGMVGGNNVDLAEAFIKRGCDAQLEVLLNAAGTPELEEIREDMREEKALTSAR